MRFRNLLAGAAIAATSLALVAGPAAARPDQPSGKAYQGLELTRQAAIDAGDNFGVAPEGSSGEGAMYLNHGQRQFCLDLEFDLPEGVSILALHLHEKAPGAQNGGVVIQASGLLAGDGQSADGCVEGDREFIRGVLSEPSEYYINAHTNVGLTVVRTEIGRN